MVVELLLNLCWLALVLPAFLLWRRQDSSDRSTRRSLLFVCTLGCLLVLLFPFISASDDLHGERPGMEESKRSLPVTARLVSVSDCDPGFSQPALPSAGSLRRSGCGPERRFRILRAIPPEHFVNCPWIGPRSACVGFASSPISSSFCGIYAQGALAFSFPRCAVESMMYRFHKFVLLAALGFTAAAADPRRSRRSTWEQVRERFEQNNPTLQATN